MINIRIYFKTLPIILLMLVAAWFVSLQLTKQRIVLESDNKLNNIEQQSSPYIWNFKSFKSDIVESFQQHWSNNSRGVESVGEKPQLSLNFSGELLNTLHHSTLLINVSSQLTGKLTIQAKSNLQDDVYYYLSNIKLSGTTQSIDLSQSWKSVSESKGNLSDFHWDKSNDKVSSLVLQFDEMNNIKIDSVSIPYSDSKFIESTFAINCDGSLDGTNTPKPENFNRFKLDDKCWWPSNYMWLNDYISKTYPGSVLILDGVDSWQEPKLHKVNQHYNNNLLINLMLYGFVVLFILAIVVITNRHKVNEDKVSEQKWYLWTAKQLAFKGAIKAITPYHLMLNYSVVLIPTALLLIMMLFVKVPSLAILKMLPVYFLWALFQQFILGYVLAQRIFYNKTQNRLLASLLAAAVFSLLHMPSVNLMIMTFIAGGFWAYAWLVFKRFIPLALSHSMLAIFYYAIASERLLYSAKTFQWFWK